MSHLIGVCDSLEYCPIDVVIVWVSIDKPVQEQCVEWEPPVFRRCCVVVPGPFTPWDSRQRMPQMNTRGRSTRIDIFMPLLWFDLSESDGCLLTEIQGVHACLILVQVVFCESGIILVRCRANDQQQVCEYPCHELHSRTL